MFSVSPADLSSVRCQVHWASQLLSAAADHLLPKAADDSHSNLGWNAPSQRFEGRAGVFLHVQPLSLSFEGKEFALSGKTLSEASSWLAETIGGEITFRDYEMPEHPVGKGEPFSASDEHLKALGDWFSFGQKILSPHGSSRIWPHHFDLGFLIQDSKEGQSLGGGFALGDNAYGEPYFYINPYGLDRPSDLPTLALGHWTEHWFGAVLTASEIPKGAEKQGASAFVIEAIEICGRLMNAGA